jgi:cobalt/nickel transport system ATP-binding protein
LADSVLSVSRLTFAYPGSAAVLGGVSFSLHAGEHVALLGANGAGKSTLLLSLNGILKCSGDISIRGLRLEPRTIQEVRRRVGLVFQDPDDQLFCPTIEADVAFGPTNFGCPPDEVERRVERSLNAVGMLPLRHKAAFQLSFGERRRAALATVLACEPDVLVLDEPSANLDPLNRRRLIEWIKSYPGVVLTATHDLDLALETSSRVLLMSAGALVADGPAERLLRDQALLEQYGLELPLRLQGWP